MPTIAIGSSLAWALTATWLAPPLAVASLEQVRGERGGVGVVEDDGRRQAQAGDRAEPVAQLDRGERVEAELLEGPLGLDLLRRRRGRARRRPGRGPARARSPRALPRAGPRAWRRASRRRRCGAWGRATRPRRSAAGRRRRPGPEAGGVERASPGPCGARRRAPRRRAPGRARRRAPRCPRAASAPGRPRRARRPCRPRALPQAPGDRGRRQAFGPALLGERVEEGVGGGVVGLAGAAEGAGDRGEEDEGGEVASAVSSCRCQAASTLGAKTRSICSGAERLDRAVVERPGAVDHRAQGVLGGDRGEQLLQRLAVGDVAGGDRRPRRPAPRARPAAPLHPRPRGRGG